MPWSLVFHIRTGVTNRGHCNATVTGIPDKGNVSQIEVIVKVSDRGKF